MTKNQKIFLVILAVIVLLYIAAVTLGIKQSSSDKQDPKDHPWASVLSNAMSTFAPRIELSKLSCNNHPIADYFFLNASKPHCDINLALGLTGDKDFWKTDLVLSAKNKVTPDVYFYAKYPKKEKATDPEPDENCLKIPSNKVLSDYWLAIDVKAETSKPAQTTCWLKSDSNGLIGLTVTEPTILTITCHGCTLENKKNIQLRFKQ